MSAPLIWVGLPLIAGIALLIFGRSTRWTTAIGVLSAACFALLAWLLPVGSPIRFGAVTMIITPELTFLGRQLVIPEERLGMIGMAFAAGVAWFLGSYSAGPGRRFVPFGMIVIGLLVAGVSVSPWIFQGIFFFMAIVLCVPMLAEPGAPEMHGVLRFLSFQVIGVPFLLMASSLLTGLESTPPGLPIVNRPVILLGLGFAFLLALFPFHAWIPRLFEEAHPYAAAFLLVILPGFFAIAGFQVIDRFVFLRSSEEFFTLLRSTGIMAVLAGALWTAFQRHLGRVLGFMAVVDTGFFLLAMGAGANDGPASFFPLLAARTIGFLVMSLGLASIHARFGSLHYHDLAGAGRSAPEAGAAVLAGACTVAGLPLLPGFFPRLALIQTLGPGAPAAAFAVWLGMLALVIAALRILAVLWTPDGQHELSQTRSEPGQRAVLAGGVLLLFLTGILPGWIIWLAERLPAAFPQLLP